ncbi:tetratricopeptide repeat protein [Paludisphaera soli]|uniref:tetratricopeptide repeat protein n=1 Tax=Paludisphaera soli TaxID=2712865 RepID=UPI0013EDFFAA|nr:tetratricopeptide repeat protein [Paludisphaera soli]
MPEYLLTGRDATGKTVTESVEAGSTDEAVRIAREAMGLDEVVLHTDDAGALYSRQADVAGAISPRDYLRFRDLPAPIAGLLVLSRNLYRGRRWTMLLALGVVAFRRWDGRPWSWVDWLATAYLLAPALFAAAAQIFRGEAGSYERMIDAVAWGRWEEVLRLVDELQGSNVPPEELAFQRARALAGLGRVEEGLAAVAPYGDGEVMPEWLYLGRLPDVLCAAQRFEEARAAMERALELAPDNPTILLDMARFEARHGDDPRRARELLEEAREHALSDVVVPFALALEGQIVRAEGRPREAVALLEEARGRLSAFRHASPLIGVSLDYIEADLALAHAAAGDADAASRHARRALPRLRAQGDSVMIGRLRSALGPAFEG